MIEFTSLKRGIGQIEKEVNVATEGDEFINNIKPFYDDAHERFKLLESLQKEAQDSFNQVVPFYGENAKTAQPNEFFSIFHLFSQNWKVKKNEWI
jgi:hypothetical protein